MEGVSKKPSLILGQFQTSFNVNPTLTRDQKEALDPPKRILKKQSSLPREGSSRKQVTQIQNLSRKIETGPRINFLPNFNNQDQWVFLFNSISMYTTFSIFFPTLILFQRQWILLGQWRNGFGSTTWEFPSSSWSGSCSYWTVDSTKSNDNHCSNLSTRETYFK